MFAIVFFLRYPVDWYLSGVYSYTLRKLHHKYPRLSMRRWLITCAQDTKNRERFVLFDDLLLRSKSVYFIPNLVVRRVVEVAVYHLLNWRIEQWIPNCPFLFFTNLAEKKSRTIIVFPYINNEEGKFKGGLQRLM